MDRAGQIAPSWGEAPSGVPVGGGQNGGNRPCAAEEVVVQCPRSGRPR